MKGVIPDCLGKLIKSRYGKEKWIECLEGAGLSRNTLFLSTQDISDEEVLQIVSSACYTLNMTLQQVADAFGEYWINEYAPKIYKVYYRKANSAKELLLNMDEIHQSVTKNIKNAQPPRFDYHWKNENTLIMTYKSSRDLIDFAVGLIKGVGHYFNEDLRVAKLAKDQIQVVFPKASIT